MQVHEYFLYAWKLFRKYSGMETFLAEEEGNKKPHSLGRGAMLKNPSLSGPEEIKKNVQ